MLYTNLLVNAWQKKEWENVKIRQEVHSLIVSLYLRRKLLQFSMHRYQKWIELLHSTMKKKFQQCDIFPTVHIHCTLSVAKYQYHYWRILTLPSFNTELFSPNASCAATLQKSGMPAMVAYSLSIPFAIIISSAFSRKRKLHFNNKWNGKMF